MLNMKDGFLFIDKEIDWTSRDVCNKASHILNNKKVGHSGTLDPFATGLLIVALGSATKIIPYLEDMDKTYVAELTLEKKTSTGDLTGEVILEKDIPNLTKNFIKEKMNGFLGDIEQVPPMTSAIHVNGKKLYELAHKGIEIERKSRKVHIYELSLLNFEDDKILFSCKVSKGTYIRTLGEDIAEALGTVGHLTALRRVKIHEYNVNDACKIESVSEEKLIPIEKFLSSIMEIVFVDAEIERKIKNGVTFSKETFPTIKSKNVLFVSKETNETLAIYEADMQNYKCQRGLWKC